MRGDGPLDLIGAGIEVPFSPHAWGWSEFTDRVGEQYAVFPTCVGMVRAARCGLRASRGFPHMRGDGPGDTVASAYELAFSPHAWGWFVPLMSHWNSCVVFPTCVGIIFLELGAG